MHPGGLAMLVEGALHPAQATRPSKAATCSVPQRPCSQEGLVGAGALPPCSSSRGAQIDIQGPVSSWPEGSSGSPVYKKGVDWVSSAQCLAPLGHG